MNPANLKKMNAEKRARVIAMGQMGPLGGLTSKSLPQGVVPVAPGATGMVDNSPTARMMRKVQAQPSFRMGGRGTGAAALQKRPTIKSGRGSFGGGKGTGGLTPPINNTAQVMKEQKKGMGLFKNRKKAAFVGLGLGIAASVAMNRRGEGASSGRQSNARY